MDRSHQFGSTCDFVCFKFKPVPFITDRNEVLAKVIFLHLSVIHSDQAPPRNRHPPWEQTPPTPRLDPPGPGRYPPGPDKTPPLDQAGTLPGTRHPLDQTPPRSRHPPDQAGTPPGSDTPPPPGSSRLRNTVNARPVRILLECILVLSKIHFPSYNIMRPLLFREITFSENCEFSQMWSMKG